LSFDKKIGGNYTSIMGWGMMRIATVGTTAEGFGVTSSERTVILSGVIGE
jgi:hypothetical protein